MNNDNDIVYRLDRYDKFTFLNEAWLDFAVANGAPGLVPEQILGRTLWDFISDQTTKKLYQEILDRVHAGRQMTFNFRCDAPGYRRQMEMTITRCGGGEVQFVTRTINVEEREEQELLDCYAPRIGSQLRICGWCKRVDVGAGIWAEIEEAVTAFYLFERQSLPSLTHGMCEGCFETISDEIGEWRNV